MKPVVILIFFYHVNGIFAQQNIHDEKQVVGSWLIKDGGFNEKSINLERLDSSKTTAKRFVFNENHTMFISLEDTEIEYDSGYGFPYIDSAAWTLKDNSLTIDVKGGYLKESKYHNIIIYKAVLTDNNKMLLIKEKVIKEEKSKF